MRIFNSSQYYRYHNWPPSSQANLIISVQRYLRFINTAKIGTNPNPYPPLKNQETVFFLSTRKIYPVRIFSQNSKSKTDVVLKPDLQCLVRCSAGVQQVFRTGVNTLLKKYQLIFNGLETPNPRCSGVYPVLAIEHQDRLHRRQQPPSYTAKKSGLSHFQYISKHLNTSKAVISEKATIRGVPSTDRCLPSI